ncbi:MAG: arginine--tRNA ligase, partial [Actinomycetes bacterium]
MTPDQLASSIREVVVDAVASGDLVIEPDRIPKVVSVDRPRNTAHGDYATNIALQLAKAAGRPPRDVATVIASGLTGIDGVVKVEVAGPGFLNITLAAAAAGVLAQQVVAAADEYGRGDTLAGTKINVEFISANPTGPLHIGHTRWAVVGDAIASVLGAAGAEVDREFYINDRGIQMDLFGASIRAAAVGQPTPQNGYHGSY